MKKLGWFGLIVKLSEERKPEQILEARAGEKRGRPRKEWNDYKRQNIGRKREKKCLQEMKRVAKDREKF